MINITRQRRTNPDISIAPLVDCVFLLLIFFLLTSTFHESQSMNIDLPSSATADRPSHEVIEITLTESGDITLAGEPTTVQELTGMLTLETDRSGKRPVLVVADHLVPLGKITEIIDCVREAKLDTVSIATKKKQTTTASTD